jgi:hypothetical protein
MESPFHRNKYRIIHITYRLTRAVSPSYRYFALHIDDRIPIREIR